MGGRRDVSVLVVRTDLALRLRLGCRQLEDERPRLAVGG